METTIRKFSEALEHVQLSNLLKVVKDYFKAQPEAIRDITADDIIKMLSDHLFTELNMNRHYIDMLSAGKYIDEHIDDLMHVVTDVFPELDEKIRDIINDKKKSVKESRRTNITNKKLYESIMRDVSKIVKRHLNEKKTNV